MTNCRKNIRWKIFALKKRENNNLEAKLVNFLRLIRIYNNQKCNIRMIIPIYNPKMIKIKWIHHWLINNNKIKLKKLKKTFKKSYINSMDK